MADFNEFDQQGSVPAKETGSIISHAFEMYKGIFVYPLIAGLLFFVLMGLLLSLTGMLGFITDMAESGGAGGFGIDKYEAFYSSPFFYQFIGGSFLVNILVFSPLVVGIIYLAHKQNMKQTIQFSDLFIGFRQNMLNIVIFGIIFSIAAYVSSRLCYLPAVFVMPFLFLGYPFLLFQNANAIEALTKSFEVVKDNYFNILLVNLLAYICSCLGIIGCFIGIILTYMFYYSTMYSAYCAYVATPKQIP